MLLAIKIRHFGRLPGGDSGQYRRNIIKLGRVEGTGCSEEQKSAGTKVQAEGSTESIIKYMVW